jgi:hypothetical protein
MRLFLLEFKKEYRGQECYALVFAKDEIEAFNVAKKESQERFGIRKMGAFDFKVVRELKKAALLLWGTGFIPCELLEEEFEEVT